jgi:NodT family efflux transporter outer membrane factor (OMF) lipoprotein
MNAFAEHLRDLQGVCERHCEWCVSAVIGVVLVAGATMLLLPGCMVGPDYRSPIMNLPARWSDSDERPRPRAGAAREIDLAQWWRSFNDPTLNELIDQALVSNLDEKIALSRIREERAYLVISRAGLFPTIDLAGSYTRQRYSANTPFGEFPNVLPREENNYEAGFDASWELDVFGGIRRGVQAAKAELAASVENARDVRVILLAEVARDYVAARALERRILIAKANLRDQGNSLTLTQERFQMGYAPELDVFQARSLLASTQSQVPMLENEQEEAIHRLGVLLGREPEAFKAMLSDVAPIPGGGDPDAIAMRIPAGLPSDLLRRRPDIRGAEREIAAATARVGVATADLFPKFYITGTAGLESISTSDFFFATSRMWTVGPSMTWRIFSAGRIRATIAARNAQEEQALYNYRKTVLSALAEVEDALVAYGKERTRHEALLTSAHAFQQSAMLARERYQEGYSSYINVLEAQRSLYSAQDAVAQSDQQLVDDLIAFYKALGGGWQTAAEPSAAFNQAVPTTSRAGG